MKLTCVQIHEQL